MLGHVTEPSRKRSTEGLGKSELPQACAERVCNVFDVQDLYIYSYITIRRTKNTSSKRRVCCISSMHAGDVNNVLRTRPRLSQRFVLTFSNSLVRQPQLALNTLNISLTRLDKVTRVPACYDVFIVFKTPGARLALSLMCDSPNIN